MKVRIVLSLFVLAIFSGCDPADGKLVIVNNSNDTIYYQVSEFNDSMTAFPIVEQDGKVNYLESDILPPNEKRNKLVIGEWESFINESCKDSAIRVFFLSKTLIDRNHKDSIMKYQLYSKKDRLNVNDLEKLNWRVTYP